jgi:hypothetical protein
VTASETLGTSRNAWWRREDSNCVPTTQSYRTGLFDAIEAFVRAFDTLGTESNPALRFGAVNLMQ